METIPVIILSLVFSALFSGIEIAFISANKFRIELGNKQGKLTSKILSRFVKSPSQFIGTLLVGNNIALVIYGIFMAVLLTPVIQNIIPVNYQTEATILLIQTIISTILILLTAEFLPKVLFRINPNHVLDLLAIPILVVYFILYPVVYLIKAFSEWVLKTFFKVDFTEQQLIFGQVDLDHYIKEIQTVEPEGGALVNTEIEMFQNALDFINVKVRECMIHRTEIVAIDKESSIEDLRALFIETGLSKILVFEESIDNIIGFVHSYEMFKKPAELRSIILPISIIPESMSARDLLSEFTRNHKSIALVVDEFGGTAGIVTIEDIIEEIFGEIDDEHDVEDQIEEKLGENEFVFSGRMEIDHINSEYNLELPVNDDYETLAGFIMHHHGSIPDTMEEINIPPYKITILEVSETRIEKVRLEISDELE